MHIIRRLLVIVFAAIPALLPISIAAHASAQVVAYSMVTITNRKTTESNQNANYNSTGFAAGVYYGGHRVSRIFMGGDIRGIFASNQYFGLIGFRVALQPKYKVKTFIPVKPYAEVLLGGGKFADLYSNLQPHMIYEAALGIDCMFGQVEYRLLELAMGTTPGNDPTESSLSGLSWVISESMGLGYRF